MITKYDEFEKMNEELLGGLLLGGIFTFLLISIIKAKLWKFSNEGPYEIGNWNVIKLMYRWIKTFKTYKKFMSLIRELDNNILKNDKDIKNEANELFGKYTYGYGEQTSLDVYVYSLKHVILGKCDPNKKSKVEDLLNEFEDEVSAILKDGRSNYKEWADKLTASMKINDIGEFSKIYNIGNNRWKDKYKNENPEYDDIIDGANIGIFDY